MRLHGQLAVDNDTKIADLVQRRDDLVLDLQWLHIELRELLTSAQPGDFCFASIQFQPV